MNISALIPSFLRSKPSGPSEEERGSAAVPTVTLDDLARITAYSGQRSFSPWEYSIEDGDKFFGGFGATLVPFTDYWTLRARSDQLFGSNLYARGLIRRLITNELNVGLIPEASPEEEVIGVPKDSLVDWSETIENRFALWGKDRMICDWKRQVTWGELQKDARREALIGGDVLVIVRQDRRTDLPSIQLIPGQNVQTPSLAQDRADRDIREGVELDDEERHVAYWVHQRDGTFRRVSAYGRRSRRRTAWLLYGTDKRHCDVRGQPLLSILLQSMRELDRYRDAATRKAVINALLAMFIEKTDDKPPTRPVSGGAQRVGSVTADDAGGSTRKFNIAQLNPGIVVEELQKGERPVPFNTKDVNTEFPAFEEALVAAMAWANEIPPEILRLAFSNNYSASQAAINEFKIYLEKFWAEFGSNFCQPVYNEWMLSELLLGKFEARGLLESWRDPHKYDVYNAWLCVDWYGLIKPSTDMKKQAEGSKLLLGMGLSTYAREARQLTGTKFSKNIRRLKTEAAMLAEVLEIHNPLMEKQQQEKEEPETETKETE